MKKKTEQIDEKILRNAVKQALKQPRLAFYSPLATGILNYRKSVIPRYSISDELATIVEAALKEKYPSLTAKTRSLISKAKKSNAQTSSKQPGKTAG
ncbi:MAG: hypothetical protein NZ919_02245 [Candidatus Caldarchaeum sp.]|nr:hypothetical protein [Candidatus Caldarchaeum sp.]